MAVGEISEGHAETFPLGSIAHLKKNDDHIIALAALWTKERPEDVEFLKNRHENGQSIDVSWELNYDVDASKKDNAGVLDLRNVEMNAVTIVGLPSYMGRTPVTAIASKENHQGDENTMDTINREDHDKIVGGLNKEINELKDELKTANAELEELRPMKEELTTAKAELDEIKPQLETLTTFKAEFGRGGYNSPCESGNSCNGDFDCDTDVDGSDAAVFKADFGRGGYYDPCPTCPTDPWCVY